jgi:hypothetical protein
VSPKSAAERKAAQRARQHKEGLRKLELWIHPEHHPKIKRYAERLERRRRQK